MLKLINIVKDYVMKDQENVHALKGITLNFRRSEFVAILGQSGCGKTTLLNITGGLDRYTSGDLIINGTSTKNYTDRDWDTYRNHSIGFVFQTYNLIMHQNILKNVELALTIAGIDKDERKQRAKVALEKVGLKGLERKKPNQLSGGQMQRVAIARALVNNPEIVLADEPTGALDSETSLQIMDLLKEISKDCLVIMVTHNPELADTYATRIVNMKDGIILNDSNPYSDEEESLEVEAYNKLKESEKADVLENKGNKKKSSMSFFTATGLSFSNLLSKLKRTILISIAGSIGIIGISMVLAVSQGVTNYVKRMQDDMLSEYPITVAETSVDYASLMSGLQNWDAKDIKPFDKLTEVGLDSLINYLMDKYQDFTSVKTNDINDELLAYIQQLDPKYYSSISYDYGVDLTNNIYTTWKRHSDSEDILISLNGLTQMYISELTTVEGFAEYAMFVDLFTNFLKPLPGDTDFILSQYDLLGNSRMAENENEIMLVVDEKQTLTDLILAQMGYFSQDEFLNIAHKALIDNWGSDGDSSKYTYPEKYTFEEILGKKFYYYPNQYTYDSFDVLNLTFTLTFPNIEPYTELGTVQFDLDYNEKTKTFGGYVVTQGFSAPITFSLYDSGIPFDADKPWLNTYQAKLSSGGSLVVKFDVDTSASVLFGSNYYPLGTYQTQNKTVSGYMYDAIKNINEKGREVTVAGILKRKPNLTFGSLSRGVYVHPSLVQTYMNDMENANVVSSTIAGQEGIEAYINNALLGKDEFVSYVTYEYTSFIDGEDNTIDGVFGYANSLNSSFNSSLSSLIKITGNMTTASDTNRAHLRSLSGLASKLQDDYTYQFGKYPYKISFYPKNFKSKDGITRHFDDWNNKNNVIKVTVNGQERTLTGEDREEITYTDTVELIIRVINTMILAVTIALVAFTSLSLVVSSFMIAVITYISVMERIKEIGVIRSLGGRKKDVSRLFIAECLMTGLSSGVIGIVTTYILSLIFNLSIAQFGVGNLAALPILTALIMIAISIVLNVLSGLIPAMHASRQDPVYALRSE